MADKFQIAQAMDSLGTLWGAEHAEGDDRGVGDVERMAKLLRRFAKKEQAEAETNPNATVREGTYQLADGRSVYFDDGQQTKQDAADLYAVLDEKHKTGSPNLENDQAHSILTMLRAGGGLGETHLATLHRLLVKHKPKIEQLRQSRDRQGQDFLATDPSTADDRIVPAPPGGTA